MYAFFFTHLPNALIATVCTSVLPSSNCPTIALLTLVCNDASNIIPLLDDDGVADGRVYGGSDEAESGTVVAVVLAVPSVPYASNSVIKSLVAMKRSSLS